MEEEIRIGVFICHCGVNIGSIIDVEELREYSSTLDDVVLSETNMFTCSSPGQNSIVDGIKNHNLNRVVVAACSPKMHEATFRNAVERGGLNPYLFEMANIREQSSWVHPKEPERATEKARTLVRMAVAKARLLEPIEVIYTSVTEKILIVGGGVAGLKSALDASDRGMFVTLIEKSPTLGGNAARIGDLVHSKKKGSEIVKELIDKVKNNSLIKIYTNTSLDSVKGAYGDYNVEFKIEPRYVLETITNPEKGVEVCPEETLNEYEFNLNMRKAIFKPYKGAYPDSYSIDMKICTKCNLCVEACDPGSINLEMKAEIIEDRFGTIITATGFDPYEPIVGEYGYKQNPNVITLLQLERLIDQEISLTEHFNLADEPKNIVFISCVGSLQDPDKEGSNQYCSRMCCSASFKNMIKLRDTLPDTNVFYLYRDIRTYARRDEHLYEEASKKRVMFMKYELNNEPIVNVNGGLDVQIYDKLIREQLIIPADIVVLAQGMVPRQDFKLTNDLLKLPCSREGWVQEAHAKLRPIEIPAPGIYIAGSAQGPKDIIETITSASAAASKAVIPIIQGEVVQEPMVSIVDEEVCGACGICISACPYEAIEQIALNGRKVAHVDSRLCAGCGTCAAACPSGAMQQKSFKDKQIISMIKEVIS